MSVAVVCVRVVAVDSDQCNNKKQSSGIIILTTVTNTPNTHTHTLRKLTTYTLY